MGLEKTQHKILFAVKAEPSRQNSRTLTANLEPPVTRRYAKWFLQTQLSRKV